MKSIRRTLLVLFAAFVIAVIAWSFKPKPIPVETTKIVRGPFLETVDEPGKTRVRERFVISAPVSGELERIVRKPGDVVNAGDVVASIKAVAPTMLDARTRSELEGRLRSAEAAKVLATAAVDKAKTVRNFQSAELARVKALEAKGAAPGRDLEKAELDYLIAEKEVRTAELSARVAAFDLEVAKAAASSATAGKSDAAWTIQAPLTGRILRVLQTSQGVVAPGTPLLEIADPTDLEVVASLLTADAVRVQVGARTFLERWGGDGALEGRVRTIEPAGYTKVSALGVEEQRVDVVIDLLSPPSKRTSLGDGFRVHTRTVILSRDDVVKTSSAALFRDGDRWALFVVDKGRAYKRHVGVERRSGLEAIVQGVDTGTTVIAFPATDLADGKSVVVTTAH
ncbi:MAG: efflux RND transporter periplasmic adaptor subunit [Polyangiales bacterium]